MRVSGVMINRMALVSTSGLIWQKDMRPNMPSKGAIVTLDNGKTAKGTE